MDKIFVHKRSFLTQIAFISSYGAQFSFSLGYLIESMSSLQIAAIILMTSFLPSDDDALFIFHQIRDFAAEIGFFSSLLIFGTEIYVFLVWLALSVYLLGYLTFMLVIVGLCMRGKKINKLMRRICTLVNIIHSKVLFSPICFFYMRFLLLQKPCGIDHEYSFVCKIPFTVLTAILITVNYALAFMKELYFYQTYRNKNMFSVTNNIHAIIQLAHKAILLPLIILTDQIVLNSILNFVFTLLHHEILFFKFPFYKIKFMKAAVFQATICTAFSLILVWKALFKSKHGMFELFLLIFTPMFVKANFGRLNSVFENILSLKNTKPEYIVHLPGLLKDYIQHSYKNDNNPERLDSKTFYTYGLIKSNNLDILIRDFNESKDFKYQRNLLILQQLLRCYRKNPKSVDILLFLGQFFVEKIKNVPQAVIYVQKTESLILSTPALNNLYQTRKQLERVLLKSYSGHEETLEFVNYFKYTEVSTALKKAIEKETIVHIEFWQTLLNNKVEVHKAIEASWNLDVVVHQIKSLWHDNEAYFTKNFPIPLIIYLTYLSIIRGLPHMSQTIMTKSIGKNSKLLPFLEKWLSQEKALIIASNQKGQLGKVLDASHSIKNLFHIEKEELIGRKINILMPAMVREKHDSFIQRYNEKPMYELDEKLHIYCKTNNGLFFSANLRVKVYPYIDKGSALIGIFEKKEEYTSIFFLDVNGTIVDCSQELLDAFHLDLSINKEAKIQDFAPEFERINNAFNTVYLPQIPCQFEPENLLSLKNEDDDNFFRKASKTFSARSQPTHMNSEVLPIIQEETMISSPKRSNVIEQTDSNPQGFLLSSTSQEDRKSPKNRKFSSFRVSQLGLFGVEEEPNTPTEDSSFKKKKSQLEDEEEDKEETKMSESKKICEEYASGNLVLFKSRAPSIFNEGLMKYFVTVEHLIFDHQLYKVVIMKKIHRKTRSHNGTLATRLRATQADFGMDDAAKLGRRRLVTQNEDKLMSRRPGRSTLVELNPHLLLQNLPRSEYEGFSRTEDIGDKTVVKKGKKTDDGENENENIKAREGLHDLFTTEKKTPLTTCYFFIFYLAMLLVVVAATIGFVITNNSFKQIELAVKLLYTDSQRLLSLIKIFENVNIFYSAIDRNEVAPIELNSLTLDQIQILQQANRDLVSLLKNVNSQEILDEFYRKDIHLWEADPEKTLDSLEFTVFTASNILADKLVLFCDKRSLQFGDKNLALFILNNTANDVLLSAERELTKTEEIKSDVYSQNLFILQILSIGQSLSLIIVSFSLIALAFKILKAYQKLFKALLTIPNRHMEMRKQQLIIFQQNLSERTESMKFIQSLDSFYHENSTRKKLVNVKAIDFKEENKLFFNKLIVKGIFLLVLAFLFFLSIFGLFYLSNALSLSNFDSVKYNDDRIKISIRLAIQPRLLTSNLLYWTTFYDNIEMRLRNELPEDQITKNLKQILNINQDFVSMIGNQEGEFLDPNFENILSNNVCAYLDKTEVTQKYCNVGTRGNVLGLLGVNNQYHDIVLTYAEKFKENLSLGSDWSFIFKYLQESLPFVIIIDNASSYLLNYLLESLIQTTKDQNETSVMIYSVICVSCIGVTLVVRLLILEKLAGFYKKRHRILRLIPQDILFQNKAMLFYLKKEFKQDISKIKSIL